MFGFLSEFTSGRIQTNTEPCLLHIQANRSVFSCLRLSGEEVHLADPSILHLAHSELRKCILVTTRLLEGAL